MAAATGFTVPAEWSDEERMLYLLSPFPPDWIPTKSDPKCTFWSSLVLQSCRELNTPLFTQAELAERLRWRELRPKCLPRVLQSMEKSGQLWRESQLEVLESKVGWVKWGVGVAIKPVTWAWRSYFSPEAEYSGHYIVVPMVKELAQGIIRLQQRDVVHKATDRVMSRADFYAFCRTNLPSENILRVVETTLLQEGSISVGKSTSDLEVVKVRASDERVATPVTSTDIGIVGIKNTVVVLEKKCLSLEERAHSLRRKACERIKLKDKAAAIFYMRQSKQLERTWKQREAALHNVQTALHQIEMAETDAMIVQAYRSGTKALLSMRESCGLTAESAETALEDLATALQESDEVVNALGGDVYTHSEDEEVLLKELDELLTEDSRQKPRVELPVNELEALDVKDSFSDRPDLLPATASPKQLFQSKRDATYTSQDVAMVEHSKKRKQLLA